MLIDVDHFWANPLFDANRCSIGYHTFHQWYLLPVYFILAIWKKPVRWIGVGLILHIATDFLDCLWMRSSIN